MLKYKLITSTKRGLHIGSPFVCLELGNLVVAFEGIDVPLGTVRVVDSRRMVLGTYQVVNNRCEFYLSPSFNCGLLAVELFLPNGDKYTCSSFEVKSTSQPTKVFNVYPHIDDLPRRVEAVEEKQTDLVGSVGCLADQIEQLFKECEKIETLIAELDKVREEIKDLYTRVGDPLNI